MRRVLEFFRWRRGWWAEMSGKRPQTPAAMAERVEDIAYAPTHKAYLEGNVAYATRQATRLDKLGALFEAQWRDIPDFISMGRAALGVMPEEDEYLPVPPAEVDLTEDGGSPTADEEAVPPRPLPGPIQSPEAPASRSASGVSPDGDEVGSASLFSASLAEADAATVPHI